MPFRYEDLGPDRFQRLCQALVILADDGVTATPTGQADGGFDGFRLAPGTTIKEQALQVKWTAAPDRVRHPAAWLLKALEGEGQKIQAMKGQGTKTYLLITNVRGTAAPERGAIDRTNRQLLKLQQELGVELKVWWREDLDRRLELAPAALKHEYPEILVGAAAMIAFLQDALHLRGGRKQLDVLMDAVRKQHEDDSVIGFRQGRLKPTPLDDLFVDVTTTPRTGRRASDSKPQGAVDLMASAGGPDRSVIFGAPGQGKSTLVQKLCQVHRTNLIERHHDQDADADTVRLPFKVILRDYGSWLNGVDPFAFEEDTNRPRGAIDSIESFVSHMISVASGGQTFSVDDLVSICDRLPTLFAFDGLDEVADIEVRQRVVDEITAFEKRTRRRASRPRLVVTSRPSYDRLPEPSSDIFINLNLDPLHKDLRLSYLRKWASTNNLDKRDRQRLERIFRERSDQAHVRELATNPMQLTILLYLIQQRGESIPDRRTELYKNYVESFLDREAEKSADVLEFRDDLEMVTAFLGWYLQSTAEADNGNGRAPRSALLREMRHFLADNRRDTSLVERLFTAVTLRVWVLTSRVTDTYEFDVQSIREYFAAQFVFDRTPGGQEVFTRFHELAIRPYWNNVTRFMAGLFRFSEKSQLADDFLGRLCAGEDGFAFRRLVLILLADGIWDQHAAPRKRLVTALFDPLGVRLAVDDYGIGALRPPTLDRGGRELISKLKAELEVAPSDAFAPQRAMLLMQVVAANGPLRSDLDEVITWWLGHVTSGAQDRAAWVSFGRWMDVGTRLTKTQIAEHFEPTIADAIELVRMGATAATPELAEVMLRVVLDGHHEAHLEGKSDAAGIARLIEPADILATDSKGDRLVWRLPRRVESRLRDREPAIIKAYTRAHNPSVGQVGTTSALVALADAIAGVHGNNWISNELVIAAALSKARTGHTAQPDDKPFGYRAKPSALLRDLRTLGHEIDWWLNTHEILDEPLDQQTWLAAAVVLAPTAKGPEIVDAMIEIVAELEPRRLDIIWRSLASLAEVITPPADHHPLQDILEYSPDLAAMLGLFHGPRLSSERGTTRGELWKQTLARAIWHRLMYALDETITPDDLYVILETDGPMYHHAYDRNWDYPPLFAQHIEDHHPWPLLLARDRAESQARGLNALASIADDQGWFDIEQGAPADPEAR